jgi:hypothetical protein
VRNAGEPVDAFVISVAFASVGVCKASLLFASVVVGLLFVCDCGRGAVWFHVPGCFGGIGDRSASNRCCSSAFLTGLAFMSVARLSGGQSMGVAVCFDFCAPQEPCVIRTSPADTRERGVVSLTARLHWISFNVTFIVYEVLRTSLRVPDGSYGPY